MATAIQTGGTYNTNNLTYDRNSTQASVDKPTEVSKASPCPHCGKPDWCYRIGKLTVCNRDASPAQGWEQTSKTDRNGKPYYATTTPKKQPRPKAKTEYIYHDRSGQPLVKVTRIDDGNGKKRIFQSHWDGKNWVKGLTEEVRAKIPIYRYAEVMQAKAEGKPIFTVEGEDIVDWLWKMGLAATTTLGGAGKYRLYGNYKADLEGGSLVLCPDRDEPGLKHMEDIFGDFPDAKWLYAPPSDFYWTHLPKNGGLDLKDWIDSGATVDDILQAIEDRRVVVDALNQALQLDADRSRPAQSKYKQKFNMIRALWSDRLRWNTLKKHVELDGQRLPLDGIKTKIAIEFDIDISREDAKEIVLDIAREHPYNPVVEYLETVALAYPNVDVGILDALAARYFGTSDPLHAALMKRTLIAAVARAFQPGCKHDEITILQGKQKALKSTFLETLAGEDFFTDDINGTEKDEILKLSQYWFIEYAEFENAYKKKDVSQLKAFLARRKDSMRRPYGTDIEDFPRPSILVGSTNQTEFLYDPTGERRFWVIKVLVDRINIKQLKSERDLIWAAAVAAYRSGEQWWLTPLEDNWLEAANKQFQNSDPWEGLVLNYVSQRSEVSTQEILTKALNIEINKLDKASQMRVTDILKANGWVKGGKKRINGVPINVWTQVGSLGGNSPQTITQQNIETQLHQEIRNEVGTGLDHLQSLTQIELQSECSNRSNLLDKTFQNSKGSDLHTQHSSDLKSFENGGGGWISEEVEKSETVAHQELQECSTRVFQPCVPSPSDPEMVQGNAELLREAITVKDWETIKALTEQWTPEFKQLVWEQLTDFEKEVIHKLRPQSPALKVGTRILVVDETETRHGMKGVIKKIVGNEAICDFGTQLGWTIKRLRKPILLSALQRLE
ncbi:MAG: hypothetical protein NHB32_06200 [Fischerella sp. CENA71]|nr:hypothetical protein [Fischerella sp. CENA71]